MDVVSPSSSISCSSLLLVFSLLLFHFHPPLPPRSSFLRLPLHVHLYLHSCAFIPPPPPFLFSPSSAPFCPGVFSSSPRFPVCAPFSSVSQSSSLPVHNILLSQVQVVQYLLLYSLGYLPLQLGSVSSISTCSLVPFSSLSCLLLFCCLTQPPPPSLPPDFSLPSQLFLVSCPGIIYPTSCSFTSRWCTCICLPSCHPLPPIQGGSFTYMYWVSLWLCFPALCS